VSIDNALSTAQITYLLIRTSITEGENDCNPLAGKPMLKIWRILNYSTVIAEWNILDIRPYDCELRPEPAE